MAAMYASYSLRTEEVIKESVVCESTETQSMSALSSTLLIEGLDRFCQEDSMCLISNVHVPDNPILRYAI